MGLCASHPGADDAVSHKQASQQQANAPVKSAAPAAAPAAAAAAPAPAAANGAVSAGSDDSDYRSQLNGIFLFLVDRLMQVMEGMREDMSGLAVLRFGPSASYLQLFGGERIEAYLRHGFDLSGVRSAAPDASALERETAFAELVAAAQKRAEANSASEPSAKLSRAAYTTALKQVCVAVQSELQASASALATHSNTLPRHADIATQLSFFSSLFDFTRGDIASDAKLLDANIDALIQATSA